jgi:hypothetical protein
VVVRVLAGVVALGAGMLFALSVWNVVLSRFGAAGSDPHGYGLIFGAVLGIVAGFIVASVVPLVVPRRLLGRAYALSMSVFAVIMVLLIAAVVTA